MQLTSAELINIHGGCITLFGHTISKLIRIFRTINLFFR